MSPGCLLGVSGLEQLHSKQCTVDFCSICVYAVSMDVTTDHAVSASARTSCGWSFTELHSPVYAGVKMLYGEFAWASHLQNAEIKNAKYAMFK